MLGPGPRGLMGSSSRGRGGTYRGNRGGGGASGTSNAKGSDTPKIEAVEETDKTKKEDKVSGSAAEDSHDLDDPAIIGASISKDKAKVDTNADKTEEPAKNLISGQVCYYRMSHLLKHFWNNINIG